MGFTFDVASGDLGARRSYWAVWILGWLLSWRNVQIQFGFVSVVDVTMWGVSICLTDTFIASPVDDQYLRL